MSVKIIVIESDNIETAMAALRVALAEPSGIGLPADVPPVPVAASAPPAPDLPRLPAAIMLEVCRAFHLRPLEITGGSRQMHIIIGRQVFCYLCRQWTGFSLVGIAKFLGQKDHTSALDAVRKVKARIPTDTAFASLITSIEENLIKSGIFKPEDAQ